MDKGTIGQRPEPPTGCTWEQWESDFQKATLPLGVTKSELTREIFLAGQWLDVQLERVGATQSIIDHECSDLGSSFLMLMIRGEILSFAVAKPLWDLAREKARKYGWKAEGKNQR